MRLSGGFGVKLKDSGAVSVVKKKNLQVCNSPLEWFGHTKSRGSMVVQTQKVQSRIKELGK